MTKTSGIFQYYVEGDDEKRLIEVLKTDMRLIIPGKVQILNVVQERLSDMKLRTLHAGTILVFVFDTDVGDPAILNENITKAKQSSNIKDVYCVPQVKNIEDELIRAMGLKNIEELLNSRAKKILREICSENETLRANLNLIILTYKNFGRRILKYRLIRSPTIQTKFDFK